MKKIIIACGPTIVENNEVLLNKHGDTKFWKFCGGRIELQKYSLEKWCKIKVRQEMGIDIKILDDNPFITFTRKQTEEGEIDVILVHFLAERIGEIKPGDDIREWDWLDIDNLPKDLGPNILLVLKHFNFIK